MKISPLSSGGHPGQTLGSVDVGRTADPVKLERARAIARGEKISEQAPPAEERTTRDIRKLKMRTNFSTNREDFPQELVPGALDPATELVSSTPEVVEAPAVEATQPLSPQFAALARQKRALQLEKAEFEKSKAGFTDAQSLVERLKLNPLSVLQENGVTYDQLTEAILGGQQGNPEILELKAKIKALEEGVDSKFQSQEDRQEEAALTEMLDIAESLAKEGDTFELIRERDAYDQVLKLIHSTYKKTGRVLDVSEAMTTIENQLLSDAEKFAGLSKVRSRLSPPVDPLQPQPKPAMRTLTARDTANPAMSRRARAIAAAMGTLRK